MARSTPLLLPLLCLAVSGACNGAAQGPPACRAPQANASASASLVADDTSFAVAFYQALGATGAGSANVVVSPYSVSSAMTMVDVGASGQTDSQIQSALHLAGGSAIASAYATVACGAQTDGTSDGNDLSIANALWGQQGKAFESSFLSVLSNGYAAPLKQADFEGDPGGAVAAIDDWVSSATHSRIPMLLTPADVTTATRLVLVDAVYFAGVWDEGFDPGKTQPAPFTLTDGTMVSVPTYAVGSSSSWVTLRIPARDPEVSFLHIEGTGRDGSLPRRKNRPALVEPT